MKTKIVVYLSYVLEAKTSIKNADDANLRHEIEKFLEDNQIAEKLTPNTLRRVAVRHEVVDEE